MAPITLDVLTRDDAEQIRKWRNQSLESLRTPYPLTYEQQQQWYDAVVNNREANARWWAIRDTRETIEVTMVGDRDPKHMATGVLLGYTGIQHIDWINSHGEISLLIGPEYQGKGYGTAAVDAVLRQAFYSLNLHMVWGEHYPSSALFWSRLIARGMWYWTTLPARKYVNGEYRESIYFSVTREQYDANKVSSD